MLCSTIIPTIGRPTLDRAVQSVLSQELEPSTYEVIVVNDSGKPLSTAQWQQSPYVKIVETNRSERCFARNVGAALSSGKYLHFLDDDDYILAGSLHKLLNLAESSQAMRVYGGVRAVHRNGTIAATIQPIVEGNIFALHIVGESIHLGASLIRRDLFMQLGGFDPLMLPREDFDLECRLAYHGDIQGISDTVACIGIGEQNSSTQWSILGSSHRLSREKSFDLLHALSRIRASNHMTPLLWGRVCRAYLASALFNMRSARYLKVISRIWIVLTMMVRHSVRPIFWRGVVARSWFQHS